MKKQALGSTPTFENVAKATLTNDLFSEEEITEAKEKLEEEKQQEEKKEEKKIEDFEIYDPFKDPNAKELVERAKRKKDYIREIDPQEERENLEKILEQSKNEARRKAELEARKEELIKNFNTEDETIRKVVKSHIAKPTNKQRLANGYIRATFEISDEHLEIIKALAEYKEMKQKDILEALLERGLADINEETKERALKQYRTPKDNKKNNKAVKELFN